MAVKTALIIDDEPDVTTYHGTVLSDHGWKVHTANSGIDGIAIAQEKMPDVIRENIESRYKETVFTKSDRGWQILFGEERRLTH